MSSLLNASWSLIVDIFSVFCSIFTILSFTVAYITWYNLSWDKGWEKKLIKIQWYDTVVGYYKDVPLIINIDFKFINIKDTFELSYPKYWKKAILKGYRGISTWIKNLFTEDKLWKTFLEVSDNKYNYFYNIDINVEWNDKKEEFIISIYSEDELKIVLRKEYNYKTVKKNKSPTDNKTYLFTKLVDNPIMSKKHRCREKMIYYSPWIVEKANPKQVIFFNEKNEKLFNKYMFYANKLSTKKNAINNDKAKSEQQIYEKRKRKTSTKKSTTSSSKTKTDSKPTSKKEIKKSNSNKQEPKKRSKK